MKKQILFFSFIWLIFLSFVTIIHAQSFGQTSLFYTGDFVLGGSSTDAMANMCELSDGNLLFGGISFSNISGDKSENSKGNSDYWIIKTDSYGKKFWDKTYGGNREDVLYEVIELSQGGFMLMGYSYSGASGDKSEVGAGLWLVKLDSEGNKTWDKTYLSRFSNKGNIHESSDGNFIIAGAKAGYTQLLEIDANGNVISDKIVGKYGAPSKMIVLPDGGVMLAFDNFRLIRLDAQGNPIWNQIFEGNNNNILSDIVALPNGDFLVGGFIWGGNINVIYNVKEPAQNSDYQIMKIDSQGNKLWDNTIVGDLADGLSKLIALPDGGFMLGGYSTSGKAFDKSEDSRVGVSVRGSGLERFDYWIVKVDSTGNQVWDKTIGGNDNDIFRDMLITQDGRLLAAGHTRSLRAYDKTQSQGGFDFWITELAENIDHLHPQILLIDPITQQTIQTMQNADKISPHILGTDLFAFEFNVNERDIGSVRFELQGPVSFTKTENQIPYALFGKNTSGEFLGKNFPPGDYTLKITPHSKNQLKGRVVCPSSSPLVLLMKHLHLQLINLCWWIQIQKKIFRLFRKEIQLMLI